MPWPKNRSSMPLPTRLLRRLVPLLLFALWLPCQAQEVSDEPRLMRGYILQNAITPESYVIENSEQLKAFVATLPSTVPSKIVPAPANKDPLLKGGTPIDFDSNILVVAVGRNTISRYPRYTGTEWLADGSRQVAFRYTVKQSEPYPFGWAVYSALVLPRVEEPTVVQVTTVVERSWP